MLQSNSNEIGASMNAGERLSDSYSPSSKIEKRLIRDLRRIREKFPEVYDKLREHLYGQKIRVTEDGYRYETKRKRDGSKVEKRTGGFTGTIEYDDDGVPTVIVDEDVDSGVDLLRTLYHESVHRNEHSRITYNPNTISATDLDTLYELRRGQEVEAYERTAEFMNSIRRSAHDPFADGYRVNSEAIENHVNRIYRTPTGKRAGQLTGFHPGTTLQELTLDDSFFAHVEN